MYLGQVNDWTSNNEFTVPFITLLNTNNKIDVENGEIRLKADGYWNIDGFLELSGVAGEATTYVTKDGVEDLNSGVTVATSATGTTTVPISYVVKTKRTADDDYAKIGVIVNTDGLTVNGRIRIQYVR